MLKKIVLSLVVCLTQPVFSLQSASANESQKRSTISMPQTDGADESHSKLRNAAEVEKYLKGILTPERLRLFCVHETRWMNPRQCLVPQANRWKGQLYSAEESGVGRVTWFANIKNECADRCSIRVDTSNRVDYWYLVFLEDFPQWEWRDEDFLKMRIQYILDNSVFLYCLYHKPPINFYGMQYHWWDVRSLPYSKLIKQNGQSFVSQFVGRKELWRVKLSNDYKVEYVLVRNRRSKDWDKVLAAYDKNLDRLNLEH